MPYENVTAHEWERTALYFAVGMLLIVTAAIFLFAINRIVGAILWFVLSLWCSWRWSAGTRKRTRTAANSAERNSRYRV